MKVGRPPPSLLEATGNICGFLSHWVEETPERAALFEPRLGRDGVVTHRTVTFAQLDEKASRIAHGLASRGVGRADRVLVMVPMSIDLYAVLFAIGKLGACSMFVDPWASLEDLVHMAKRTTPRGLIAVPKAHVMRALSREFRRIPLKVTVGGPALLGTGLEDVERGQPNSFPAVRVAADDGALLTFTTGSSGRPKGALRSHGFMNAQGDALARHLPRATGDVEMTSLPSFVLSNLSAGVPSVLPLVDMKRIDSVDPAHIVRQLQEHAVTTLGGSPPFVGRVARYCVERGVQLEGIRGVATGGAAVPAAVLEDLQRAFPRARSNIRVLYGATEVEPISQAEADEILAEQDPTRGVLVGRPVPELSVRVVTWSSEGAPSDVPDGQAGEVLVAGAHVQAEYFQDVEATSRTKVLDEGVLWHRTGDVARLDDKGRLWLLGRAHEVVGSPSRGLYPIPVAAVAAAVTGVRRAALTAVRGEPVVAIELEKDASAKSARAKVSAALEEVGLGVEQVVVVPTVPVDPRHNAKVDQSRLRALLEGAA